MKKSEFKALIKEAILEEENYFTKKGLKVGDKILFRGKKGDPLDPKIPGTIVDIPETTKSDMWIKLEKNNHPFWKDTTFTKYSMRRDKSSSYVEKGSGKFDWVITDKLSSMEKRYMRSIGNSYNKEEVINMVYKHNW